MKILYKKPSFIILIASIGIALLLLPNENTTHKDGEIEKNIEISNDAPIEVKQTKSIYNSPHTEAPKPENRSVNNKPDITEGVNTNFHDKPKTQVAWMERGKDIVVKNNTEADTADFQKTFFHRGAKAMPVTCGEVQFSSEGTIIADYQRFVFTGVQSTYLESNVKNFDIFWSIMCEQTLDEYSDALDQQ